jgi:hypothetical protein
MPHCRDAELVFQQQIGEVIMRKSFLKVAMSALMLSDAELGGPTTLER